MRAWLRRAWWQFRFRCIGIQPAQRTTALSDEQLAFQAVRVDANRRGHVVIELAILTMLIDAKLVTIEEAAMRIEQIQSGLPEVYQDPEVSLRTKFVTDWLRSHTRQPAKQWQPVVIEGGNGRVFGSSRDGSDG